MASSKEYLMFLMDQLSGLEGVSYKTMMGEYILYYEGKIIGGIYDDRFLVRPTQAARRMLPDALMEKPYDGAKEMLLVGELDDRVFLSDLVREIYEELPEPKKRGIKS